MGIVIRSKKTFMYYWNDYIKPIGFMVIIIFTILGFIRFAMKADKIQKENREQRMTNCITNKGKIILNEYDEYNGCILP